MNKLLLIFITNMPQPLINIHQAKTLQYILTSYFHPLKMEYLENLLYLISCSRVGLDPNGGKK